MVRNFVKVETENSGEKRRRQRLGEMVGEYQIRIIKEPIQ